MTTFGSLIVGGVLALLAAGSQAAVSVSDGAKVFETTLSMKTYPFSDPDPVPATDKTRYPYFFFDGTTDTAETRTWKAVILENDKVKVTILPEIGGKVWGAVDKVTGREFIYYNHVVKFRNISQRGPWCSGGIEFNFGIIGHGPWTATPVSYVTRENADGSVSCFVSETELVTRSTWQVEINLPADAEGFFTRTQWYNGSGFPMPYYQWMNAAYSVRGNPTFEYPGTDYIFHDGKSFAWPIDPEGHDLSVFEGNAFGGPKSEHVVNGDNGIYGIWWPEAKFGSGHFAHVTQKYGRKVWLWPLSRSGGIWEDLLTDEDGQYTELQSGRVFNQPGDASYLTPFKHPTFAAGTTDTFEEEWRVVRDRSVFEDAWKNTENYSPRPLVAPDDFDWSSVYGLTLRGEQRLRQKMDREGEKDLLAAVAKDKHYLPALSLLASLAARHGEYLRAREYAARALAINTYDPEANYADGVACLALGKRHLAKERFGLAAFSPFWRAAAFVAVAKIELSEGNWSVAATMADKALDADRRNPEAQLVKIVSARRRGDAKIAARLASGLLASWPLFHAARYELNQVDPASAPFASIVRNELPQETYLEVGTWYESAGQLEDAAVFFKLASEKTSVGSLRLAHVLVALGRTDEAQTARAQAASAPIAFALPFRRETMPAIEAAVAANDSWKFVYLKAVLLAGLCRDAEAGTLLRSLGDGPDDATFYLYRAAFAKGEAALHDLRRAQALDKGWRAGLALSRHYVATKNPAAAVKTLEPLLATGANKVKIAYANALVGDRRYREAVAFLEANAFLPSEHGDNASSAWIDAGRALAEEALAKGDRVAAKAAVKKALSYPEKLGVGRPYELDFKPGKGKRNPLADWSEELRQLVEEETDGVVLRPGQVCIALAPTAPKAVQFAAKELRELLGKVLGCDIPVTQAPTDGATTIVLGTNDWSAAAELSIDGLARDAFRVKVAKNRIYIAGRDDPEADIGGFVEKNNHWALAQCEHATLYGVYDFLERFADCGFYFPGEIGTVTPRVACVRVPTGDYEKAPVFTVRDIYIGQKFDWPEQITPSSNYALNWLRLRLQTENIPCTHGSREFRYIERFAKTHPEYLAQKKDGTRWDNPKVFAAYQLCWSDPGFRETAYQDVKAYLTGQSASSRGLKSWGVNCVRGKWVDLMPEDSFQGCFCARCQAAYNKHAPNNNYATKLMWGFAAEIGDRLIKEGVPGNITMMAYPPYRALPDFALPTNLHVMVAEGGPWSVTNEKRMRSEADEIAAWAEKIGHKVWIWTYPRRGDAVRLPGIPSLAPRAHATYFKRVAKDIFGTFLESESERFIYHYLNYWMYAQLAWDTDLDAEKALDSHYEKMFGTAAPEMKRFYGDLETKWMQMVGNTIDTALGPVTKAPTKHVVYTQIYSPAAIADWTALFEAAERKVAADAETLKRVRFMRAQFLDEIAKGVMEYDEATSVAKNLAKRQGRPDRSVIRGGAFDTIDGWEVEKGTVSATLDRTTFVTAPASVKLVAASGNRAGLRIKIPGVLKPKTKYRVSFFLKTENVDPAGGAFVEFGLCKDWYYFPGYGKIPPSGTVDWIFQDYTFETPAGADTDPDAYFHLMLTSAGTAWYDGLRVEEVE